MTIRERKSGLMLTNRASGSKLLGRSVLLTAALAAMLISVAPASAASPRSYVGQIDGFIRPHAMFVSPDDDVWVDDIQAGSISQLGPYPTHEELGVQTNQG